MKLMRNGTDYTLERGNGESITLTRSEVIFLSNELTQEYIMDDIDDAIHTLVNDEEIDISLTDGTADALATEVMQVIKDKMDIYADYNPNWDEICDVVREVAEDY